MIKKKNDFKRTFFLVKDVDNFRLHKIVFQIKHYRSSSHRHNRQDKRRLNSLQTITK